MEKNIKDVISTAFKSNNTFAVDKNESTKSDTSVAEYLTECILEKIYPDFFPQFKNEKQAEFKQIAKFINLNFTPYFSFYGENNHLYPSCNWFRFTGFNKSDGSNEVLNLTICANYTKNEYTAYKDGKKMGVFYDVDTIVNLFKLKEYATTEKEYNDFKYNKKIENLVSDISNKMNSTEWKEYMKQFDEDRRNRYNNKNE